MFVFYPYIIYIYIICNYVGKKPESIVYNQSVVSLSIHALWKHSLGHLTNVMLTIESWLAFTVIKLGDCKCETFLDINTSIYGLKFKKGSRVLKSIYSAIENSCKS